MIHQSSSPNQFVSEIVNSLPCSSGLLCHTLLFIYFFQRTHFFHFLPWQMPHQRFQRFDLSLDKTTKFFALSKFQTKFYLQTTNYYVTHLLFVRYKTLWEKEKMMITTIFSFTPQWFQKAFPQGRKNLSLCSKGLNFARNYFWQYWDIW